MIQPSHHFILWLRALLLGSVGVGWVLSAQAAGTGLNGEYFDNVDFTVKKLERLEGPVQFDWGLESPTPALGSDTFSVRWSGQVEADYSETYTFYVVADDGARLWVNERLVAARTIPGSGVVEVSGTALLNVGRRCNLILEFEEHAGPAEVRLEWSSPSQARQVIPRERLYPTTASPRTGGVLMEFWSGLPGNETTALTGHSRFPHRPNGREFPITFECLATNWADDYGTRVQGFLVPATSGVYRLAVSASDQAQLFLSTNASALGKQLAASVPGATAFREFTRHTSQSSLPVELASTQRYYVELLHKAGRGDDHFSVAWQPPGATGFTVVPAEALEPYGLDHPPPTQAQALTTLTEGHPRLFASEARFDWLERNLTEGSVPQLTDWWISVRNSADAILSQPPNAYDPDIRGTILGTSRSVLDRVGKLALAYRMTGDPEYAERAWVEMEAAAGFPDWHPDHFLDTAEMTHAFALGYDWLHAYWSPFRRSVITNALIVKGLNEGLASYRENAWFFRSTANNWNLVCNGGMVLGALALAEEAPALAQEILSRAMVSAASVMRHWTADQGGWYEGPGYWGYTTHYNVLLMAGLESSLGSDFGLSSIPSVSEAGLVASHLLGPSGRSFNFADAGAGRIHGAQLFWLARRYNRPLHAWHQRAYGSASPLGCLWHDARGENPAEADLSSAHWFRGPSATTPFHPADTLTLRSGWQSSSASFVGFKTGQIGDSHGHLDAGSFVFDALGVRWAHDLGGDDYALPGYFGNQRWTYYRLRAEGHNTLVLNPGVGPDQIVGATPPIVLFKDDSQEAAVVADLSSAYGVSRVWRGLRLLKDRRWLVVQDEIEAAAPVGGWWFLHFDNTAAASVTRDGSAALLTQGASRLWVRVLAGPGAFVVTNAMPLSTSPHPAGQNPNSNYRKLALELRDATNTRLAVLLAPLRPGESPPTELPLLQPLAQWSAAAVTPPPLAGSTTLAVWDQTPVEVNLPSLVRSPGIATDDLELAVVAAERGVVSLLPDGITARFTAETGFEGLASFRYSVRKFGPPATTLLYYDFEPPEDPGDGSITDRGIRWIDGVLTGLGDTQPELAEDTPERLGSGSLRSLRLVESGDGYGGRLTGATSPGDYDFNGRDWSFSGWFKRAAMTNDDFVFYLGRSDGFGSPDELQLYGPSSAGSLVLRHYTGEGTTDADLTVPGIRTGHWYHVAVVFDSLVDGSGRLSLYVDGAWRGSDFPVVLDLPVGSATVFGGHANSTFQTRRWFNGWLDDLAVFAKALSAEEVERLAAQPIGRLGEEAETNIVQVIVNHRNQRPALLPVSNHALIAGQTLLITNLAQDLETPAGPFTFALLSGPADANLDPATGVLTWRPSLAQSSSDHTFTIQVADTGSATVWPPAADTTIKSDTPERNFGTDEILTVRQGGAAGGNDDALLRFDLRVVADLITRARLRLTPSKQEVLSTHTLYAVDEDAWSEASVTAENAPAAGELLGSWMPKVASPVEIGLTDQVYREAAGDGQLSLRLRASQRRVPSSADYFSRESGVADFPQLHLDLAPLTTTQTFTVTVLPPQPPTLIPSLLSDGYLKMTVFGDPGPDYSVLVSTNLLSWDTWETTNPVVMPFQLSWPWSPDGPRRFYRLRLGP